MNEFLYCTVIASVFMDLAVAHTRLKLDVPVTDSPELLIEIKENKDHSLQIDNFP